jgi:hypothetical protein
MHENLGDMNSYFLMYEFISGGAMCECEVPPSLWRHHYAIDSATL